MICPNCGCDSLKEVMNNFWCFKRFHCVVMCGCEINVGTKTKITAKKKHIFEYKESLVGRKYLYLDKFVKQYNNKVFEI